VALSLNVLAGLIFVLAPATPCGGPPSLWMLVIFVGGPIALIWSASRFIRSTAARMLLYGEILLMAGLTCYLLLFV
jgi:hypothetical protein